MKKKLFLSSIVLAVFIVAALGCQSSSNVTAPKNDHSGSGKDGARIEVPEPLHDGVQEHPGNAVA